MTDPRFHTGSRRFLAGLIDGFIITAVTDLIAALIGADLGTPLNVFMVIAYSAFGPAYAVSMHGRFGQTLGKWIAGVRVASLSGGRLTYRQAAIRDAVPCLAVPVLLWYGLHHVLYKELPDLGLYRTFMSLAYLWVILELLTMLLNDQRRAIHDFLAETVVVRTR